MVIVNLRLRALRRATQKVSILRNVRVGIRLGLEPFA